MIRYVFRFSIIFLAALTFAEQISAQQATRACKTSALAALQTIPPLAYECAPEDEKLSEETRRQGKRIRQALVDH